METLHGTLSPSSCATSHPSSRVNQSRKESRKDKQHQPGLRSRRFLEGVGVGIFDLTPTPLKSI